MESIDLSERVRSSARAAFPWIAAVYAIIGALYLIAPPIQPAWLFALLGFGTSATFILLYVFLLRLPRKMAHGVSMVAGLVAVGFALAFVAATGDSEQTTTLLITLLGAGCLLIDLRGIVIVVLAGTLGWIMLLPTHEIPPDSHWSIDLVATSLLAIVVTAVRRRTFLELETVNRQNRQLVESAGEAIYGVDGSGRITFVNPIGERVLGRHGSALLGQSEHALLHLEPQGERAYPVTSCPFCRPEEDATQAPLPLRRPNGEIAWVDLTRTEVPTNEELGSVVTLRDVTDQTWAERALRASEERNRLVVDTALDGVV